MRIDWAPRPVEEPVLGQWVATGGVMLTTRYYPAHHHRVLIARALEAGRRATARRFLARGTLGQPWSQDSRVLAASRDARWLTAHPAGSPWENAANQGSVQG